ncbi:MAG TPA: hypothetical protein VJ022_15320, partial [Anaerolineales bacterium]|nr:hypothetical protein [Anaerolineales bacterium]
MADQYDELEKLVAEGNFAVAESRVLDWLQYHPTDARAWLLYGKCVSNPTQKRDCFKRAVELDPSNAEARVLLEQFGAVASQLPRAQEQSGVKVPSPPIPSALPTKFQPSSAVSKSPVLSERTKAQL